MELVRKLKDLVPQPLKNFWHTSFAHFWVSYYGNPAAKMKIIGVTGTDGKTTTCTLIYEILRAAGYNVGLVTTISARIGDKTIPTGFHVTTPSPRQLQRFLKRMLNEGVEYVILETTSHSLDQFRIGRIRYTAASFTNVTHEHLDYHKTYERYLKAKSKLINIVKPDGFVVINRDDKSYDFLKEVAEEQEIKHFTYGFSDNADLYATEYNQQLDTITFTVYNNGTNFPVELHLPGEYNVYNALGAIKVAQELGVDQLTIVQGLKNVKNLEGRWEMLLETPFKVIVDFAHTPNSLEKMLEFARQDNPRGKIILVFGSAGKRDMEKRPLMGKAGATYSDFIILTAEDPRGENIENINRQIAMGIEETGKVEETDFTSIPHRRKAIRKALKMAQAGDTVIIAGKGHEKTLNIDGKVETPWSDQLATIEQLEDLKIIEPQTE